MAELPDGSIEKVIEEINIDDLRNNREMGNLLNVLKKKKQNLQIEKQKIRVIICCSKKDEKIGAAIKEILATLEIESFMAHEGSKLPEKVIEHIVDGTVDAFIPLLSNNFKNSDYCSQEMGIAYFKNILIIPLSLDETVPYGFIRGFGSNAVSENNIPLDCIMDLIVEQFPTVDITGKLIYALKRVNSSGRVEDVMKTLEPYFDKLSEEEINNVVDICIENNCVQDSNMCKTKYLPEFIEINRDKIEKDKLKSVLGLIGEGIGIKSGAIGVEVLDQENG